MIKKISSLGIRFPKLTILLSLLATIFLAMQLGNLRWETDARVYLPKGHPAILYDEKVDEIFGVKDTVIVGIVNEEGSIFNAESLARIKRITDKIAALDGVQASRPIDVASLSSAIVFYGDEQSIGSRPLMPKVPQSEEEIAAFKQRVYDNAELFVGNIVSADGSAAMIRAKLKEGMVNRYMTYFQIKGILAAESGEGAGWNMGAWSGGGDWQQGDWGGDWKKQKQAADSDAAPPADQAQQWPAQGEWEAPVEETGSGAASGSADWPDKQQWSGKGATGSWPGKDSQQQTTPAAGGKTWPGQASQQTAAGDAEAEKPSGKVHDKFYLAGRPVVEVTSGIFAMDDMKTMIPAIIAVMAVALFLIFRTLRGVVLPLLVMSFAIVWTMGIMALLDVPMYTISTMLPVILVAVGIGDAVHMMSNYYDHVLKDPHRPGSEVMTDTVEKLGAPLITTSVTTAIGFLALLFAEMPPFKVFGLFAMLGILLSWLITITVLPALLSLMKPKIGGYYAKRRAMRLYEEQSRLAWLLTRMGGWLDSHKGKAVALVALLAAIAGLGASQVYVNSSWLSDFPEDSEVFLSNKMLNEKFNGTMFLHVVIEAEQKDALKQPALLKKMEALQEYAETLPYVGGSLSVVDYLKNMNMNLHAGDKAYNVLPESQQQIAEYLFLFSVSGRPQQLDEVVDFDYKTGLISIALKTDYTRELKTTIDAVQQFIEREFRDSDVEVNLAGSANNSYIWGKLLIGSQTDAIVLSKLGILLIASLIFASFAAGLLVVAPVTLSTLVVAGVAGFAGIPLDVSTALAAGIAIGVGVDYAVHYIFRYRAERRGGKDHEQATAETLRTAGRTIVLNATVVTAGFAVLFFSQFPPHVKLGYFVAAYMVVSCLVAIVLLPVLFSYFRPKFVDPARQ